MYKELLFLSRVLYKGLLRRLISFYEPLLGLHQEISRIQSMPYFKGFAFPSDITDFLGPSYLEVFKGKTPAAYATKGVTKLLNKLFLMREQLPKINGDRDALARLSPPSEQTERGPQSSVDLGQPVTARKRTKNEKPLGFDVRVFCTRLRNKATQETNSEFKYSQSKLKTTKLSCQKFRTHWANSTVQRIRRTTTFTQLSEEIEMAIVWSRSQKLKAQAAYLGNKLLKSNRLRHVESQGYSLPRKLQCMKTSLCSRLLRGGPSACTSKCPPRRRRSKYKVSSRQRKPQRKLQSVLLKETQQVPDGTLKNIRDSSAERRCSGAVQRSDVCPNGKQVLRKLAKPDLKTKKMGTPGTLLGGSGDKSGFQVKRQMRTHNAPNTAKEADDIDDIFALMGV